MCRSDSVKILCATFVAGAASAALAQTKFDNAGVAQTYVSGLSAVANGGGNSTDDCYWDNGGPADPPVGQSSEAETAVSFSAVYDDFIVDECDCLKLDTVLADFLTNSFYGTWAGAFAEATIYTDCDGCPDECVAYSINANAVPEGAESTPDANGFRKVTYQFEDWVLCDGWDQLLDEVVLEEGSYWLCVIHYGDGSWTDRGFWCATDAEDIKAAEATAESDDFMIPFCTPISETNIGKTDFVFCVQGEASQVLCDNGNCSTTGHPSALNTSLPSTRTADNFFLRRPATIEIVEVCLINNCDPHRSFLEIWEGDCYPETPILAAELGNELVDPIVIDTGMTSTSFNGYPGGDPIWRLIWCLDTPLELDDCKTYWVAPVGKGTGAFGERAFFTFNEDCKDPDCLIKISEGQFLLHPNPYWEKVSTVTGEPRDFAFKVYGEQGDRAATDDDDTDGDDTTVNNQPKSTLDSLRDAINVINTSNFGR